LVAAGFSLRNKCVINMNKLIKLQNIHKTYFMGEIALPVLKGINLDVLSGEFVCILGHSGSGKTTLMNILGCLDKATNGDYFLDGKNISELIDDELSRIRNKKIGFVFQTFNLLPRKTALENVELPLSYSQEFRSKGTLQCAPTESSETRARKLLEDLGLKNRAHHLPSQLSGGQQQRVAIARALINDPAIIIADEPTGNLDTRSSYEIMSIFQKLNAEGKTIILITHEKDISVLSKRLINLRDGEIINDEINKHQASAEKELEKL